MKKLLLVAASLICMMSSLSALDWGGLFTNTTKPSTPDFSSIDIYQSNGVSLWLSNRFNKNLRLSAEGLYKYELTINSNNNSFTNIVDLTLLKFVGNWNLANGMLSVNAGRFSYADLSSVVFNQTSDGLTLAFQNNNFKLSAYAGYTGLLNSLNVSMVDINPDATHNFYSLCPAYIPLVFDASLLNLAGNNISLQAEYFIAINDYIQNKFYADLTATGAIGSAASYSVIATLGSEDFKKFMIFGKGNISMYIGQSFIASAGAEYASGTNGSITAFKTISSRTAYNGKFLSATSGVIIPQCSAIFVLNNMVISLGEKVVLAMPETSIKLRGFDTNLNFVCNVFTDLQVGCSVIAYADLLEKANSNYQFVLNVSLAF
ncbi:MAG: hypothetical protein K5681_10140 [Treponema sp.]|nr:hypothetical protein [Treponema sp.]